MPDHHIIEMLDHSIRKKGQQSAHNFMIGKSMLPITPSYPDDISNLERTITAYEMALADCWQFAFDTDPKNVSKRKQFHDICQECASMMAVCPVPSEPVQKMVHIIKLFAYSYLGEKWEDVKRFIIENKSVWEIKVTDDSPWDYRLFTGIYKATLYLGQKKSWDDLTKATNIISELRDDQKKFEKKYLDSIKEPYGATTALQLFALYHLAKAVEMVSTYMVDGTPLDIEDHLELHFRNARRYAQGTGVAELDLILIVMHAALKKMIRNSIWIVSKRINSKVSDFVKEITKLDKPVFELLYPQRLAILEKGLLDPASRAIVVNLPTSSGKTLMAEFRILQTLNTFGKEGITVYVVPTRTLVNQVAARLRLDLGTLGVKIVKMSGAVEIDAFEESILGEQNAFDVLVTTPEKLQLLLRHPQRNLINSIKLAIIDEAHNIEDNTRGLNLEMLVSTISRECHDAHLLLLTPFIPNSNDIAKWLDPQNPKSINLELSWKPNDCVVGMYYAEGNKQNITTFFEPLTTSNETISVEKKITVKQTVFSQPISKIKDTKYALTALFATQLASKNMLVLGRTITDTWKIANLIHDNIGNKFVSNDKVMLVKKFIESELGSNFPLVRHLEKGIGVHHAGLPDDVRQLMEWLMESNSIKILVATTTIAQGVNFPVSGILVSTRQLGDAAMSSRDFWNLLGRAGRIDQPSIGMVGLAATSKKKDRLSTVRYVKQKTDDLASTLIDMVNGALETSTKLNLSVLAHNPNWSAFIQYITHMKNQADSLEKFLGEAELVLQRTYGYGHLDTDKQGIVLEAVRDYAKLLDDNPDTSMLSDITGFTPETIKDTIIAVKNAGIEPKDWRAPTLFSDSGKIATLVGIMRKDITEVKKIMNENMGKTPLTDDIFGKIISDWVSGQDIADMASKYFGKSDDSITDCVRTIYGKIINGATWGMAGIQKMPESGLQDDITDDEKRKIAIMPAMIYYGVNTEESVLMRMNNVPRGIAGKLGRTYKENKDIYSNTVDVLDWLDNLHDKDWSPTTDNNMTGADYKRVWRQLSGMQQSSKAK